MHRAAAAALLLLGTLGAAAPCRRLLQQPAFAQPPDCLIMPEADMLDALASVDSQCPQAAPWSCGGSGAPCYTALAKARWGPVLACAPCPCPPLRMLALAAPRHSLLRFLCLVQLGYKCALAAARAQAEARGANATQAASRM